MQSADGFSVFINTSSDVVAICVATKPIFDSFPNLEEFQYTFNISHISSCSCKRHSRLGRVMYSLYNHEQFTFIYLDTAFLNLSSKIWCPIYSNLKFTSSRMLESSLTFWSLTLIIDIAMNIMHNTLKTSKNLNSALSNSIGLHAPSHSIL